MGEVYRARDTKLERPVALKVLPEEVASDPDRPKRFEREARATAALSHPNVLTVFDVGREDGRSYLVFELLEGSTLEGRLARGALPVGEALELAMQIASGLSVAHARGIVHRDLKPANLFLTTQGVVKILDFGLARLQTPPGGRDTTQSEGTAPATVLGTVRYMSPEQALGKPVDPRTDLFSLGVVLYEMTTGKLPFRGDTSAAIFAAILHEAPTSPLRLNPKLPKELERILDKCLEKDPDLRYQSAQELMADLKRLRRDTTSGRAAAHAGGEAGRRRRRAQLWVAAAVLIGAVALGWWTIRGRGLRAPAGPITITPLTIDGGEKMYPRLSPDGEKVAYMWDGPDHDNWDIYVKAIGPDTKPLRITGSSANDWRPTWSPDGRKLAFVRLSTDSPSGAIFTVPALGGQERKLVDILGPPFVAPDSLQLGLSWSPDGKWLAFAEKASEEAPARIVRLSLDTLEKQPLTSPPPNTVGDLEPQISPDGSFLAFDRPGDKTLGEHDFWVQQVNGSEARRLTSGRYNIASAAGWTPDGAEILFSDGFAGGGRTFRVPFSGGPPQPVVGLGENAVHASIRGNRMVYVQGAPTVPDTWRLPRPKTLPSTLASEKFLVSAAKAVYSPDGRRLAFESYLGGSGNIWLSDADGAHRIQLTTLKGESSTPRWSPDGRQIAFDSLAQGNWDIYVVDAEGGRPRRLTREPSDEGNGTWSRDGRFIYFSSNRSGSAEIWKIPAEGGGAIQVSRGGGFYAVESEDGRSLYYSKAEYFSGVWRMPLGGGGEESEVVKEPLGWPNWALARRGVYYIATRPQGPRHVGTIQYLDFASGRTMPLFQASSLMTIWNPAVSPDEKWILFTASPPLQSEVMLMENFR
jgi:eukaryotic-like serine/threonine-protein kinase